MITEPRATSLRPTLRIVTIIVMVACLLVLVLALWPRPGGQTALTEQAAVPQASEDSSGANSRAHSANAGLAVAAPATGARTETVAPSILAEPTPESRQLVASLVNLQMEGGMLTQEVAAAWKQNLQKLIE